MTKQNKFQTQIISIDSLKKRKFSIPTYQRPYVWGDEQIVKLFHDCANSFFENAEDVYFIGTILTKVKNNESELIDGQQRFTTLWLIAFCFKHLDIECDLNYFLAPAVVSH